MVKTTTTLVTTPYRIRTIRNSTGVRVVPFGCSSTVLMRDSNRFNVISSKRSDSCPSNSSPHCPLENNVAGNSKRRSRIVDCLRDINMAASGFSFCVNARPRDSRIKSTPRVVGQFGPGGVCAPICSSDCVASTSHL